jgi:hypothetical protein
MPDAAPPVAQVRENENGAWHVAVTWHNGQTERVEGFTTELDAKEWVRLTLQTWLEGRKARDNG